MYFRRCSKYLFLSFLQLYGLFILFIGLVGYQVSDNNNGNGKDKTKTPPHPLYSESIQKKIDKLNEFSFQYNYNNFNNFNNHRDVKINKIALMVVDAMRLDFISEEMTPFLSKMISDNYGCLYTSMAHSPTVTLPRIKSLISGQIPTYYDVITNFASSEIKTENIIDLAIQHDKKIVFFGDDTWIKLFPERFIRSHGVQSFFVNDFYDIDNNVTSKLTLELSKNSKWDFLILHYLGLDHIGHVHGPKSSLIKPKLLEMDQIAEKIFKFLSELNSFDYLIVTSDHGMANKGGHGGNSDAEIQTPLVVISNKKHKTDFKCSQNLIVDQVDFASTISFLWELPVPKQSIGKLIGNWLNKTCTKDELSFAYYHNMIHLSGYLMPDNFEKVLDEHLIYLEKAEKKNEDFNKLIENYQILSDDLSSKLKDSTQQDLILMIYGLLILFESVILSLTKVNEKSKLLLIISILLSYVFLDLHIGNLIIFIILQLIVIMNISRKSLPSKENMLVNLMKIAPSLLFGSSSYVEEEHYFRYYLLPTAILVDFYLQPIVKKYKDFQETTFFKSLFKTLSCVAIHRIISHWNSTGIKWNDFPDITDSIKESRILLLSLLVLSVLLLGFLRRSGIFFYFTLALICVFHKFGFGLNPIRDAKLCFILILANFVFHYVTKKRLNILDTFICLCSLLQKDFNVPIISLVILQSTLLKENLFFFLFYASFYYQGNSNSIVSIDVNSGYTGMESYNAILVGFLIFLNTYSAPILVFLSYMEKYPQIKKKENLIRELVIISGWTNFLYSIVIIFLRNHLFIWSVFTPKLLYLIAFTVLNIVLCLFFYII